MLLCASAMDPPRRIEDAVVTARTYPRQGRTPPNALTRQPFPSVPSSAGVADARSDWDVGRYVFPPDLS
jgi:hypothetical protein